MINLFKKIFKICDHKFELISTSPNKLSISPNELLIYKCTKCGKIEFKTISSDLTNKKLKKLIQN